ncbi:hypothetical protein [Massilia sp. S19_KUP03_FR1]|uniref:hypothetical protein n=1 Tax=Massilia sp. S19_KUP03_FR1 TaxID=3025503 RepID=UPI002FCD8CF3
MQEQITYQCSNPACGHLLPRLVAFCPYCGTPQQAGLVRPVPPVPPVSTVKAVPVPVSLPEPVAETARPTPVVAPPVQAAAHAVGSPPVVKVVSAAAPPQRQPLHWIWWLAGLALLYLAWVVARPAAHKLDSRIDAAIATAQACNGKQAQSELIALRGTRATPAQLQRLQTALNTAASACERKRLREKAWVDASSAIDAALASSAPERARTRLATFTRRWGEDMETAAVKGRIEAAKREALAATPVPARVPDRESAQESARALMAEAERDISRSNYKGAIDKMDTCVAMVDAGNRDCKALKAKAERLYQGL